MTLQAARELLKKAQATYKNKPTGKNYFAVSSAAMRVFKLNKS